MTLLPPLVYLSYNLLWYYNDYYYYNLFIIILTSSLLLWYAHTSYIVMYIRTYVICDGIWENPTFCIFYQNWDFAIFSIFTSALSMSICNSTICELQHFVMQPLILPILRVVNLHGPILKTEHYSKCWIFADLVTIICVTMYYRITGYLCNSEICAFWPKKAICGFYLCVALHGGVAILP